ncbi:hypothetical protein HAX54_043342, partial [Datura stramonium]|nr:hypothetical protein [Datura stramonium]
WGNQSTKAGKSCDCVAEEEDAPWGARSEGSASEATGGCEVTALLRSSNWSSLTL